MFLMARAAFTFLSSFVVLGVGAWKLAVEARLIRTIGEDILIVEFVDWKVGVAAKESLILLCASN